MSRKKTKIVCTIGPASESRRCIASMIAEGMDVARLNMSHGSHEEHRKKIETVRKISDAVGVMIDTKGPEIRTGAFVPGTVLAEGSKVTVRHEDAIGDEKGFSISYKDLHKEIGKGDSILLDDGRIALDVEKVAGKDISCRVAAGGPVSSGRGVNVPGCVSGLPNITEKDKNDLEFAVRMEADFVAISFVREPSDIGDARKLLKDLGSPGAEIIAKIECARAVDNLEGIIKASDGVMAARGDLGVEMPFEKVPIIQKRIIRLANAYGKYSIVATEMLHSMIRNARPTRAEAGDVANAIFEGADAVMLSGETANGRYPSESVRVMSKIIMEAERSFSEGFPRCNGEYASTAARIPAETIAKSAVESAEWLGLKNIIVPTRTGFSAKLISKRRPVPNAYAFVPDSRMLRKMSVLYGIEGVAVDYPEDMFLMLKNGVRKLFDDGKLSKEEKVAVTGSYKSRLTNAFMINGVSDILES